MAQRARLVHQTQTLPQAALPRQTALAMRDPRGRMEDRAHCVWQEPTKVHQDPMLAVFVPKEHTLEQ